MVDVEVDDRHPALWCQRRGVGSPDCHMVEQAEPHGPGARGVVAGRAHEADRSLPAGKGIAGGPAGSPRRPAGNLEGLLARIGVLIDQASPAAAEALQPLEVAHRMDPGELLVRRGGQVRDGGQPGSCDGVEARGEPLGPFRVVRTAVVGLGGGVGVDDRLQRFLLARRPRHILPPCRHKPSSRPVA